MLVTALLLAGSQALADVDVPRGFAALDAFESQTSQRIVVEAAILVHDVRDWEKAWNYRRGQLESFEVGRDFFQELDANETGIAFKREIQALLALADPELLKVPTGIIVFFKSNESPANASVAQSRRYVGRALGANKGKWPLRGAWYFAYGQRNSY